MHPYAWVQTWFICRPKMICSLLQDWDEQKKRSRLAVATGPNQGPPAVAAPLQPAFVLALPPPVPMQTPKVRAVVEMGDLPLTISFEAFGEPVSVAQVSWHVNSAQLQGKPTRASHIWPRQQP